MNPEDTLSVTLTANEWNIVLSHLAEGKFVQVAPLMQKIQQQCVANDPALMGPIPDPVATLNGAGDAPH